MLQNPSKYHANPLTHFLALHQSQVGHTQPHSLAPPSAAIGIHQNGQHHHHHQTNHLHAMQQQQTQFGQQHHDHHAAAAAAAAVAIMGGSHHHHQHHSHHGHHLNSSHLIEAANTTLDVGKSFTIAAILGLQKSAIESNRKEYNNAINLTINGNGHSDESQRDLSESLTDDDDGGSEKDPHRSFPGKQSMNNNNNENINTSTSSTTTNNGNGSKSNASVSFNCDSNIVNRFLPPLNAAQSAFGSTHQQAIAAAAAAQQQQQGAGFPSASAANGASSVAARTPTALQSLQQLHQQHAQQTSMAFHREKLKTDASSTKKSSLKNKRVRTIFTPEQLERLEGEFERQQYMVGPERLYLAHTLQLTEAQVKVWFQNRRIKWRKHHLEITQQRLALLRQSQLTATPTGINGNANPSVSSAIGSGLQISSAASIPSCDDGDEDDDYNKQHEDEIRQLSRNASESDLSICNDSIDGDSVVEGVDDA